MMPYKIRNKTHIVFRTTPIYSDLLHKQQVWH